MKIKRDKLRSYIAKLGMTEKEFFELIGLDVLARLDLHFGGNTLNKANSRKFLQAVGVNDAMELIDWEAMNARTPSGIFANAY